MKVLRLVLVLSGLLPASFMIHAQQIPPFESIRHDTPVDRAWRDIDEGDTKAEAIAKAGKPDRIEPANESAGECWIWFSRIITVYVEFDGDRVKSKAMTII